MKQFFKDIFYSFPVQLFILHFRKYQVLLVFWFLLGSALNSGFLHTFGADALLFSPEYLGSVGAPAAAVVGVALGVFFMSWNITTFILHSKRCKFLATTSKPFLKYCINNAVLPLLFLVFYIVRMVKFNSNKELMNSSQVMLIAAGLVAGLVLLLSFSFAYFFGAEKTILRTIAPIISNPGKFRQDYDPENNRQPDGFGMKVGYYFSTRFRLRKARNVSHYSQAFLDTVFKRHHFAAIISILLAFVFLIIVGFFLDNRFFELPAAASTFVFFAVMTAVIGALTYFLQSWSVLFVIVLLFVINLLYQKEIIDPRNKAYGVNYANRHERPAYNKQNLQQLCTPQKIKADKAEMLTVLNNWKKKQQGDKPVMILINVSGGGLRSGTFTMNTLQQLDSITGGQLMQQTFMISGASGGMLAAAYYRELYRRKQQGQLLNLHSRQYTDNIAQDLLNPMFSSMIARDIFAPAQKFTVGGYNYVKDRGYAFEKKLSDNTNGLLNVQLKDIAADDRAANVPLIIFNSVITRDGRKMMLGTLPLSFMMKPATLAADTTASPDAVDFGALFAAQNPMNIRMLTALRMNATFPYVLPNVWLPSNPIIDVMDAGLRDNFGQETSLRFAECFKDWIKENTSGVLLLQIRDRRSDNWQNPLETGSVTDILLKPATMLQNNWYKLQDFFQTDQYAYLQTDSTAHMRRITFMYIPEKEDKGAALNFHLTAREKRDVIASFGNAHNQEALRQLLKWMK
jgi:Patatin-like phospholipase